MEMRLKGVAWDEVIEVMTSKEGTVYLRIVTEAGRFYRSTSMDLSPVQAEELGRALIAEAAKARAADRDRGSEIKSEDSD